MRSIASDLKPILLLAEHIPLELWGFVLAFILLLIAIKYDKKRHLLCKLEASQQLKRLKKINTPQEQINHLRGVNPFIFEEMILTAIKKRGHKIKRNKRYTNDGGIDGQATIKGTDYLIQAKRYKNHIDPAHVRKFANTCKKHNKRGLFVHTGKTGKNSHQIAQNTKIEIISENRLLNMLTTQNKRPQEDVKQFHDPTHQENKKRTSNS